MKIKDQVCTSEQAVKLKALGIDQRATFYHTALGDILHPGYLPSDVKDQGGLSGAAYTVAELGEMLPNFYPSWRFPVPGKEEVLWIATVICGPQPTSIDDIHTAHEFDRVGDTQAQALATLLIALLETQTITAEEVNERLNQIR